MNEPSEATQHVREAYVEGQLHDCYEGDVKLTSDVQLAGADFDAWLAEVVREASEEAFHEGAAAAWSGKCLNQFPNNPYLLEEA